MNISVSNYRVRALFTSHFDLIIFFKPLSAEFLNSVKQWGISQHHAAKSWVYRPRGGEAQVLFLICDSVTLAFWLSSQKKKATVLCASKHLTVVVVFLFLKTASDIKPTSWHRQVSQCLYQDDWGRKKEIKAWGYKNRSEESGCAR